MSKHYDDRNYVTSKNGYAQHDYDDYRGSSSRRRSTSRSSRGKYYESSNGYRQPRQLSRSESGTSMSSCSDYEYKYSSNDRPLVRVPRDVIRAPTPPPVIQRVVERAPTPEPDIVERVIVRPQPQQLIERIIERPRTPPPKIIDKEISEPAPPPIVRTRIVKVDHSPRHYANAVPTIQHIQQKHQRPDIYQRAAPMANYGYQDGGFVDYYNFAPIERSYSTTLSTAEVYPQTQVYAGQSLMQPQQQQLQPQYQTIGGGGSLGGTQIYPTQPNYNAYPPAYGYSYGYRPVNLMYNQPPQQQQQQQQPLQSMIQQAPLQQQATALYPQQTNYYRPPPQGFQQPPLGVQGF